MTEFTYSGLENRITCDKLREGHVCKVTGIGNSMIPILKSKKTVICVQVKKDTVLKKKDIVLCKVNGHFYLHLIHAIRNDKTYLIGNNHGHMNGWVNKNNIFGVVAEIL